MFEELLEKLEAVRVSLNSLTVTGYDNMYKVVGCIQYIDEIMKEVRACADNHDE